MEEFLAKSRVPNRRPCPAFNAADADGDGAVRWAVLETRRSRVASLADASRFRPASAICLLGLPLASVALRCPVAVFDDRASDIVAARSVSRSAATSSRRVAGTLRHSASNDHDESIVGARSLPPMDPGAVDV